MIGKQIRHYRIEEQIGAGGMGLVYRATDLHLDRPVAIKVLPAHLVSSPERKKRFVQEAKAASALNHPNIVTIYDVDAAEMDGHTVAFIAMEFVPGETLDHIIARPAPAKIKDALQWAIQLASALAAAHASGIVHRDIKPSNVIVTPEGQAKLLDFGLAKATEPPPHTVDVGAATEALDPSHLAALTEEGMIVGTVNYMSPEQAEAKRVDARSDIFSLGAVLYELFGGRKPFQADSKIATLSAILHKDPVPLSESVPGFREDLERAILRCLRKEPDRRWQHVSDLRIALEEVRDDLGAGRAPRPPAPAPPTRRQFVPLIAGAAVAASAVAGFFAGRTRFRRDPVTFTRLTFNRGDVSAARFAPDGSIIYSANWEGQPYSVFSLRQGIRESRSLGLGPATHLAGVSSTNELAIVLASKGTLARVPVAGGTPRELLDDALEADWSADAKELAVVRRSQGRYRVEYPVGTVLHETGAQPMRPRIAPGSRQVAFFELDSSVGDVALKVVQQGSPARELLGGMRAVAGLAWAPSGKEVWISAIRKAADNPAIFAIGLQGETRLLTQSANWLSIHDVSPSGDLLVASTASRVGIRGRLPGETESRDLSWHENSVISEMTADGALLMMELGAGEGRNNAIYYQRKGEGAVRLGDGNYPALSPDGKSVVSVRRDDDKAVLQIIPTGAGEVRVFPAEGFRYQAPEWFPDGQRILFNAMKSQGVPRAYTASAAGGPSTPITAEGVRATRVSPDGKWLVASAGGRGSWLQSVSDPSEQRPIRGMNAADVVLGWTKAGDGLLVRGPLAGTDRNCVVRLKLADGSWTKLYDVGVPEPGDLFRREFVVADEGRAYAFSFQRDLASLYLLHGLE